MGLREEGPLDPSHPELSMNRLAGMSEMEKMIMFERDPRALTEAIRRGLDTLGGIPDRLYRGDSALIMKQIVNPEAGKYREANYSLHLMIKARLDQLAVDLRIRAERHRPGYKETEQDQIDREGDLRAVVTKEKEKDLLNAENNLRLKVAREFGVEDGVTILPEIQDQIDKAVHERLQKDPKYIEIQDQIDDEAYERLQKDPKYNDPLVWSYLRDRQNQIGKEAREANVSIEEYLDLHPEKQDVGEVLVRSGLWLEFRAMDAVHSAWADRMGTTGSTDRQRGASSLFPNPGHTDLKSPDWTALFRDKEMAGREDEAMRAMVDTALGTEILWVNKSNPNDRRSVRTPMWEVMLNMRMKEPAVKRAVMKEFPKGEELFRKRAEVKKKLLGGELRREDRAAAERDYAILGTAIGKMADKVKGKPIEKYFKWENPYLKTLGDAAQFKDWFNYCLDRAGGDMRATFLAWRKFQLWEIISRKGIGSTMDDKDGPGSIDPPVGSDLAAWHIDFGGKRGKEFGRFLNSMGIHVDIRKDSESRYAAGPPVTLDHIDILGVPFLDFSKVKDARGEIKSLWQQWYENGVALGELPWMKTEDPKDWAGMDQEVSPHSFNGWLYQRFNAEAVRGWLIRWSVSATDLEKLDDEGRLAVQIMVKAFDKTFGEMLYSEGEKKKAREKGMRVYERFTVENLENPELRGKIDPRAIAVMGWITQRHPDGPGITPGDDANRPLPDYLRFVPGDPETANIGKTLSAAYQESTIELFRVCLFNGFVDKTTVVEIIKYCRLDKGVEMKDGRDIYRSLGIE